MSFDQLSSLEAGNRSSTTPSYTDDPEFQQQSQSLLDKLFKLNSNNQQLSKEVAHLGTRRDTPRVRERVHTLLEESRDAFKSVGEGVKSLQTYPDLTPPQKFKLQKLSKTFASYLASFQTLQRQALEKQKASVSAARSALDSASTPGEGSEPLLQEQQQELTLTRLAPQDEVDFQDALIVEREEEIRNIEQGVGDLNVLFQQVAQIVTEQGEVLDTIANNVENVRDDTRGADRELRSAARYQKNARSKACCLLLILAVIFTIVFLAVFLG